eukprot:snap_masked-scaffold_13-processed-gene-9.24-mRNA-1 protein AED:1.00 eAED:1.00 QI:0/0/0/0/1/1/2/0/1162
MLRNRRRLTITEVNESSPSRLKRLLHNQSGWERTELLLGLIKFCFSRSLETEKKIQIINIVKTSDAALECIKMLSFVDLRHFITQMYVKFQTRITRVVLPLEEEKQILLELMSLFGALSKRLLKQSTEENFMSTAVEVLRHLSCFLLAPYLLLPSAKQLKKVLFHLSTHQDRISKKIRHEIDSLCYRFYVSVRSFTATFTLGYMCEFMATFLPLYNVLALLSLEGQQYLDLCFIVLIKQKKNNENLIYLLLQPKRFPMSAELYSIVYRIFTSWKNDKSLTKVLGDRESIYSNISSDSFKAQLWVLLLRLKLDNCQTSKQFEQLENNLNELTKFIFLNKNNEVFLGIVLNSLEESTESICICLPFLIWTDKADPFFRRQETEYTCETGAFISETSSIKYLSSFSNANKTRQEQLTVFFSLYSCNFVEETKLFLYTIQQKILSRGCLKDEKTSILQGLLNFFSTDNLKLSIFGLKVQCLVSKLFLNITETPPLYRILRKLFLSLSTPQVSHIFYVFLHIQKERKDYIPISRLLFFGGNLDFYRRTWVLAQFYREQILKLESMNVHNIPDTEFIERDILNAAETLNEIVNSIVKSHPIFPFLVIQLYKILSARVGFCMEGSISGLASHLDTYVLAFPKWSNQIISPLVKILRVEYFFNVTESPVPIVESKGCHRSKEEICVLSNAGCISFLNNLPGNFRLGVVLIKRLLLHFRDTRKVELVILLLSKLLKKNCLRRKGYIYQLFLTAECLIESETLPSPKNVYFVVPACSVQLMISQLIFILADLTEAGEGCTTSFKTVACSLLTTIHLLCNYADVSADLEISTEPISELLLRLLLRKDILALGTLKQMKPVFSSLMKGCLELVSGTVVTQLFMEIPCYSEMKGFLPGLLEPQLGFVLDILLCRMKNLELREFKHSLWKTLIFKASYALRKGATCPNASNYIETFIFCLFDICENALVTLEENRPHILWRTDDLGLLDRGKKVWLTSIQEAVKEENISKWLNLTDKMEVYSSEEFDPLDAVLLLLREFSLFHLEEFSGLKTKFVSLFKSVSNLVLNLCDELDDQLEKHETIPLDTFLQACDFIFETGVLMPDVHNVIEEYSSFSSNTAEGVKSAQLSQQPEHPFTLPKPSEELKKCFDVELLDIIDCYPRSRIDDRDSLNGWITD